MNQADEDDFRAFVAARSASLLNFAHVLTGDRHLAEDVVQTALAKTALGWSRVRRKDNPEGYVRRAIVNTHLNVARRRLWREQPSELIDVDVAAPDAPEHAFDDRDAMWHALAELPARQRAVLVLRYYEDLSEAVHRRRTGLQRRHRQEPGLQGPVESAPHRGEGGRVNMTNVEQLLRDTLNDPRRRLEPGGDIVPAVLTAARHRQRTRAVLSAASCAVLLVVVGGLVALNHRSTTRAVTPAGPSPAVETQLDLGAADFHVGAVIASQKSVFVLADTKPIKVLRLDATTSKVTGFGRRPSRCQRRAGDRRQRPRSL